MINSNPQLSRHSIDPPFSRTSSGVDAPKSDFLSVENAHTECAWFPAQRKLVVINNTAQAQTTKVYTDGEPIMVQPEPYACQILEL